MENDYSMIFFYNLQKLYQIVKFIAIYLLETGRTLYVRLEN